ncbi:MAG: EAL domain-containing protein [Gammaproteobacteria bacterium]|nr:EAL domain-containing protein [Gammaproteobacteria bacterium]
MAGVIFLASGGWAIQQLRTLNDTGQLIEGAIGDAYRLELFTAEYLNKGSERTKTQWLRTHQKMSHLSEKLIADDAESAQIITEITKDLIRLHTLFISIMTNNGYAPNILLSEEEKILWKTRLSGQISTTIASVVGKYKLYQQRHIQQRDEFIEFTLMAIGAGLTLFLLLFIWRSISFSRRLVSRISYMADNIDRMQIERYNMQLSVDGKDELSLLANSFNSMAASIVRSQHEIQDEIKKVRHRDQQLILKEEALHHLAHHDPLTSLPNLLLFRDRFNQAIIKCKRLDKGLALLFVDLDNFKEVNDSLGHSIGDRLLQVVADRLSTSVRSEDTVARLGGDEFIIIISDLNDAADAKRLAQKLLNSLKAPIKVNGYELNVTASIGISSYPNDGEIAEVLLRNADAAMYHAKESGRNTFEFYTAQLTEKAFDRVRTESALRKAIEQNQFIVYYQPQVDLASGRIIGSEALVRWQHPEYGVIPPIRFLPIAEETGQIVDIGKIVLRESCKQLVRLAEAGYPEFRMAVNLSTKQMGRGLIVNVVKEILQETGCNAKNLDLEITESTLVQSPEDTTAELNTLRALGISIAIDDFGTGYSSLSYLKRFPISKLKIDRSFVSEIPLNADDCAISKAIIALGKALGLVVIAEGVEEKEQADFLIQQGCEEAQGYYYSKPLSDSDLMQFLADQC